MNKLELFLGVTLCVMATLNLVATSMNTDINYDDNQLDDATPFAVDKKAPGMRLTPFRCNGYDHLPRCLHGGKGPRKTWTKAGRFCVCLCRARWVGPECAYSEDSLRKRYPWKGKRNGVAYDLAAV